MDVDKIKDKADKDKKPGERYLQRRLLSKCPEDWFDIDVESAEGEDVEVDEYLTPDGQYGYTISEYRMKDGKRERRTSHYGPEKYRDKDNQKWIECPTEKAQIIA